MAPESVPPAVESVAADFHEWLNARFNEVGKFSPHPGSWELLPEDAKLARRLTVEWAMNKSGNGLAATVQAAYQEQQDKMRLIMEGALLKVKELQKEQEKLSDEKEALKKEVARPMEPIDIESLIPLTRDQDTEAAVQKQAIIDAQMIAGKQFGQMAKSVKHWITGQLIFMACLGGFLLLSGLPHG